MTSFHRFKSSLRWGHWEREHPRSTLKRKLYSAAPCWKELGSVAFSWHRVFQLERSPATLFAQTCGGKFGTSTRDGNRLQTRVETLVLVYNQRNGCVDEKRIVWRLCTTPSLSFSLLQDLPFIISGEQDGTMYTNFAYPNFKDSCSDIKCCFTPFISNDRISCLFRKQVQNNWKMPFRSSIHWQTLKLIY